MRSFFFPQFLNPDLIFALDLDCLVYVFGGLFECIFFILIFALNFNESVL